MANDITVRHYENMQESGVEWIGMVPTGWKICRGKVILKPLQRKVLESDEVITCFRDGEVTLRKNRREDGFTNSILEIGYQGIDPGDLVVHGMDGFAGAIGISDSRGKASPVLNVLDSLENKRYLMYYLRMLAYRDVFVSLATGIRIRSCDLRWNKLANLPFLLPDRGTQEKIAKFLDNKCFEIENTIANIKSTIAEYKDWKSSIIHEAVTKGLTPNVEMKVSGIEWIGQIPAHWSIGKIKQVSEFAPKCDFSHLNHDSLITFTPMECIRNGCFENRSAKFDTITGSYTQYAEGDIVLAKVTPCFENGNICIMKDLFSGLGLGSSELFVLRAHSILTKYLFYYLQNPGFVQRACASMTGTGGLKRVSSDFVKNCPVPIPPKDEQDKIAFFLNKRCNAIDALIKEKNNLVEDLESYKKSLIYEVVTGKRKIC